ncbi:MAG: hypothetical protein GY931_04320 [Maribacter sp.]|nr:hypothetical protein [Maribacter sp.]
MKKIGLILFLIGALLIFGAGWIMPWFTSPVWSSAPPEQFEGTVWEAFGPIFMVMSFLPSAGILLIAIGTLLLGDSIKLHIWLYSIGIILVILSFLYPPTLGYYPLLFGIGGLFILVFFFAVLWYWAQNHRNLDDSTKTASVYQLIGYIFFFLIAMLLCTILGNPFSGLYFPEKVIEQNALPFHYSFGTKVLIYFVLAMFFTFLGQYKKAQQNKNNDSSVNR